MKLILTDTNNGYSWSNSHRYYLCETQEEYDEIVEQYKNHENYIKVYMFGEYREMQNYVQVQIGVGIHCRPHTEVSDGYAVHGGHTLDAEGITISYRNGTYTSYEHYIKPGSIKVNETEKTESWWV